MKKSRTQLNAESKTPITDALECLLSTAPPACHQGVTKIFLSGAACAFVAMAEGTAIADTGRINEAAERYYDAITDFEALMVKAGYPVPARKIKCRAPGQRLGSLLEGM